MSFIPKDLSKEDLELIQLEGLKWTVNHTYNNSSFYKQRYDEAGIKPGDINSLDDLTALPFTDNHDLQANYPLPLKSVPDEEVVRIHGSSGTTGKRKILCYTAKDIDVWANFFARCYEIAGLTRLDRVQIAVGYGLWTAGAGFQLGCERFGAMTLPLGPVNVDMHCEMLVDMGTTAFCSTASMALLMAEEVQKRNLSSKIKLKKIILGAERHSESMRSKIKELLGVDEIYDIYGMTEVYGPGTGLDCSEHSGIHYWSDHFIYEILDPETHEPVPKGEIGELVVTTLKKEGSPLVRYRTHDLTRLIDEECPCGVIFPKHGRIQGRSDDMFIFRAVNIYPSQIDHILSHIDNIGSEYQIHLNHEENGRDMMLIKVERDKSGNKGDDAGLAEMISAEIRKKLLVRSDVIIMDYDSLPRTQRKSKRVYDNRSN